MKKFLVLALLAVLVLLPDPVFAARVKTTEIMDTDFNAVTTSDNSTAVNIQGRDKVSFVVTYDETEVALAISAAITVDISFDGTNYLDASFYDYGGGATLQTSETISADGRYYFWFNKDLCVPYVRVNVVATNTDVDDLLTVKVSIATKE